jgi:uncharacterized protein YjbI with pentapeptide repeats
MANVNFLELLDRGAKAWNEWRTDNPGANPDLRAAFHPYDITLNDRILGEFDFTRMDLRGAHLDKSSFSGTVFRDADLREAHISKAHFVGTTFCGANLGRTFSSGAVFQYVDLSWADLRKAQLFNSIFAEGTNLTWTDFSGALLDGANFNGARVGWTIFGNNDLSRVQGLEGLTHEGPITLGVDTIYRSRAIFPPTFIEDAQLPPEAVSLIHVIADKKSLEYQSCFISYSRRDATFANRLYQHLMNAGVNCWIDKKRLTVGELYRSSISDAMKEYDRVLVIISKHSLDSLEVEEEVLAALEREEENRPSKIVLPVTLDDAVMSTDKTWGKQIRDTKQILAFKTRGLSQNFYASTRQLLGRLEARGPVNSTSQSGPGH